MMRTVATKMLSRFKPQFSEKSAAIVVAAATTTAAVGPQVVSWKMDGKQCVFTQSKLYKMKVTRFSFSVCALLQMLLECFCQSCQQSNSLNNQTEYETITHAGPEAPTRSNNTRFVLLSSKSFLKIIPTPTLFLGLFICNNSVIQRNLNQCSSKLSYLEAHFTTSLHCFAILISFDLQDCSMLYVLRGAPSIWKTTNHSWSLNKSPSYLSALHFNGGPELISSRIL